MSFPRYPSYKDSGMEWLGEVPQHWEPIRYKNVFREKAFNSGAHRQAGSISFGRVVFKDDEAMNEATKATYQEVLRGEFLINPINLNYDLKSLRTALSEIDTCVSPAYIVLQGKIDFDRSYMKHQLSVFDVRHMKMLGAGVRQTISFSDIGACLTQLPPVAEQANIAAFLDRETGKIDELVAEQRRLMDLLKEKRQAVISHAVTKALDPDAPMKPSGIEWLGDIPVHWETRTIAKSSTKITNGFVGPTRDILVDEGTPYIQATHIKNGRINFDDGYFVTSEWSHVHAKSILTEGDVLIVQTGAGTGDVALVSESEVGFNCHALIIVAPDKSLLNGTFLSAVLQSTYGQEKLTSIETGAMHPHLNCGEVKFVDIPLPPLDEQADIVTYIRGTADQFDTLTAEAQRAIDLLQERRTALISAAVTGQIDVRHLTEKEAA